VSPRVVQRLMGHSSLDMTNRYTRPRVHDIEGAVSALPSLRPRSEGPERAAGTGTDGQHISDRFAQHLPNAVDVSGRKLSDSDVMRGSGVRMTTGCKPSDGRALDAVCRVVSGPVVSDRGGARTHDQGINVPHRLSPTPRDGTGEASATDRGR